VRVAADRSRAKRAAAELLENCSISLAPVDPFEIARHQGITVHAVDDPSLPCSGFIFPSGDSKFTIVYSNASNNEAFQRFTVSHELAHYEMVEHQEILRSGGGRHVSESNFISPAWYEQEADCFAASLLMPEKAFTSEIRRGGLGLATIRRLADTFKTSLSSTAIRYAELTPDPILVVVSDGTRILYVLRSDRMRSFRSYVERGSPIPAASTTARLMASRSKGLRELEGVSWLSAWSDNPEKDLEFSEDVIDLGQYGRVLTILHRETVAESVDSDDEDDY